MKACNAVVLGVLALCPAVAFAGHAPKPPDTTVVTLGPRSIELWPYTGTDFSGTPSDPVNLFFVNTDPLALREALLALDGNRPQIAAFPLPVDNCRWIDGMGDEQTNWAEVRRWVGSEIQLVCTDPAAPLGDTFRFHLRLFKQGHDTVAAGHFEIRLPGTGQHQVLSWDFARDFIADEMERVRPGVVSEVVPLITPGSFRSIPALTYGLLAGNPQVAAVLDLLGIDPANRDLEGNPVIPTSGDAIAFSPHLRHHARRDRTHASTTIDYDVLTLRPFCTRSGSDFVHLGGPVHFEQKVSVNERGEYHRTYEIDGDLMVTPIDPSSGPTGPPVPARVRERHRARLDRHGGQVTERVSQELLGPPGDSLSWFLAAGDRDHYEIELVCGP